MDDVIDAHLKDPTLASHFIAADFTLDALVTRVLSAEKVNGRALSSVLHNLDRFAPYLDQILEAMPDILRRDKYSLNEFFPLLKTSKAHIALGYWLEFLKSDAPIDDYWVCSWMDKLCKDYAPLLTDADFDTMYGALKGRGLYAPLKRM